MFSGIFCGAILEYQHAAYLLKMVQQISMRVGINGSREGLEEYIGTGEDHAMSFNIKDVIDLAAEGVTINYREKALNGNCDQVYTFFGLLGLTSPPQAPFQDSVLMLISRETRPFGSEVSSVGSLQ